MDFNKELTFIKTDSFTDSKGVKRKRIEFQDDDDKIYNFLLFRDLDFDFKPYTLYNCILSLNYDKNYNLRLNFKGVAD